MSEKKILREMIADNNKQHTKGSSNYISTKKEVAKKMKGHINPKGDVVPGWKHIEKNREIYKKRLSK